MPEINHIFSKCLNKIAGKICASAIANDITGSAVLLNFREGKPVIIRISKKGKQTCHLLHEYDYCLYIQDCSWRLAIDKEVIASNYDPFEKFDPEIIKLQNVRVTNIKLSSCFYDIELGFDSGHIFQAFCNQNDADMSNYTFFDPNFIYTVESKSILKIEARTRKERKPFYLFNQMVGWY